MLRLFDTHKIRKSTELSGRLWTFTPLSGSLAGCVSRVMVPHCWETMPGMADYRGWCSYETAFSTGGGHVRLEFKGISHYARIFVDGAEKGSHYGSYTPFSLFLRNLPEGKHTLRVLVDNEFRDEYPVDFPNDYRSYGGISRGVVMEEVPDCCLRYVHLTPLREEPDGWLTEIQVSCENLSSRPADVSLRLSIEGQTLLTRPLTLQPGETLTDLGQIPVPGVTAWSPQVPHLYSLTAVLLHGGEPVDDWIDRVGFRTVAVQGKDILLNGQSLRIKGLCRHEDHPQYGCALPAQAIASDLQLVRDLHANSIRTVHYPNDERMLDLCDEMGILVWEENHARGLKEEQMRNPYFEPHCEQVIREMITAHYNHPSIYVWGILNECASDTAYGRTCYAGQFDLIRRMDASRPCTFASCMLRTDCCQDLPDISSWNLYPYWYVESSATEMVTDQLVWLEKTGCGGKPFLVSEIGAGAIYGFHDAAADLWSEERQARILRQQLSELTALDDCAGLYIWQFCDVRVAGSWAMSRPKTRNNKGIVDEYRRPKLAYSVVRDIFAALPDYR